MYALCFDVTREGYHMVLGNDNNKYHEQLTCRTWYDPAQLDKHYVHEHHGIKTYYIGEDVLHMFDPKLELLDVLEQLHKYVEQNMNTAHADRVCQQLLGHNTGVAVYIKY